MSDEKREEVSMEDQGLDEMLDLSVEEKQNEEAVETVETIVEETEPKPEKEIGEPAETKDPETTAEGEQVDETGTEAGTADGETTEELGETDELKVLQEQNKMLLDKINELSGKVMTPKVVEEKPEEKPEEKAATEVPKFIKDEDDLDEILDSKEKLNGLLNNVVSHVVGVLAQREPGIREGILTSIPGTVMKQVQQHLYMQGAIKDFYTEHPQLVAVKQAVGVIANEVAAEHPDWTVPQVFTETADKAYKTLGLKKQAVNGNTKGGGKAPSFVGSTSSRVPSNDQRSGLQKEIDELIDL